MVETTRPPATTKTGSPQRWRWQLRRGGGCVAVNHGTIGRSSCRHLPWCAPARGRYLGAAFGGKFNKAAKPLLKQAHLNEIKSQTRCHALSCFDNMTEVESRRDSLPEQKRRQLNDPQSVWREFKRIRLGRPKRTADIPRVLPQFAALARVINPLEVDNVSADDAQTAVTWLALNRGKCREAASPSLTGTPYRQMPGSP